MHKEIQFVCRGSNWVVPCKRHPNGNIFNSSVVLCDRGLRSYFGRIPWPYRTRTRSTLTLVISDTEPTEDRHWYAIRTVKNNWGVQYEVHYEGAWHALSLYRSAQVRMKRLCNLGQVYYVSLYVEDKGHEIAC